jgi:hypothetical protein
MDKLEDDIKNISKEFCSFSTEMKEMKAMLQKDKH